MENIKSSWHADGGARGLNAELFHSSAIRSNTFFGLKDEQTRK
jgi:hypothetical protein